MKKIQILLRAILVGLSTSSAIAQTSVQNGALVTQGTCRRDPFATYEHYVSTSFHEVKR